MCRIAQNQNNKIMNYKKLFIGITIANIFAWAMVELWINRYADTLASGGATALIIVQIIGYYLAFVLSADTPTKPKEEKEPITPANCPGHDWQQNKYSKTQEECMICGAERGKH